MTPTPDAITIAQAQAILDHAILSAAYEPPEGSGDGHWIALRLAVNPAADAELERQVLSAAFEGVPLPARLTVDHFTGHARRAMFLAIRAIEAACEAEAKYLAPPAQGPRREPPSHESIGRALGVEYMSPWHDVAWEYEQARWRPCGGLGQDVPRLDELRRRRAARRILARAFIAAGTGTAAEIRASVGEAWRALGGK